MTPRQATRAANALIDRALDLQNDGKHEEAEQLLDDAEALLDEWCDR